MKKTKLFIGIFISILVAVVIFMSGYKLGKENSGTVFYANIVYIENDCFHVHGLEVNDVNYRGEYTFSIDESTECVWHGTEIKMTDLALGDRVAITYTGEIMETSPAKIKCVTKIQLLDDEI